MNEHSKLPSESCPADELSAKMSRRKMIRSVSGLAATAAVASGVKPLLTRVEGGTQPVPIAAGGSGDVQRDGSANCLNPPVGGTITYYSPVSSHPEDDMLDQPPTMATIAVDFLVKVRADAVLGEVQVLIAGTTYYTINIIA